MADPLTLGIMAATTIAKSAASAAKEKRQNNAKADQIAVSPWGGPQTVEVEQSDPLGTIAGGAASMLGADQSARAAENDQAFKSKYLDILSKRGPSPTAPNTNAWDAVGNDRMKLGDYNF